MKIGFDLIIAIFLSLGIVLTIIEVTRVYEKEYVSSCCNVSYRKITTTDRQNQVKTRNYCLNCRKWCDPVEKQ